MNPQFFFSYGRGVGCQTAILGEGGNPSRRPVAKGVQEKFGAFFGKIFVNRAESIFRAEGCFFLQKHRAAIHPCVEKHYRDAREVFSGEYSPLNGRCSPVSGQKRPVDVQSTEREDIEERLRKDLTESHHHGALSAV